MFCFFSANVRGTLFSIGEHHIKNGKDYVKPGTYTLDIDVGQARLHFDHIFGDNEELNESTNKALNDNISVIVEEFKPVVTEILSQFIFGIMDRIFDRYSWDELFAK